jgi:hypothetical protein
MKVVFLLDNNEYVEVAPEKLQIRQIAPGQSALGLEVTVPVRKEDGTTETNEDGTPKTQTGFRPFINYAVNLSVPTPAEVTPPVQVAEPVAAAPAPVAKSKVKAKAKAAKRRTN